jgi:hypothetical protein
MARSRHQQSDNLEADLEIDVGGHMQIRLRRHLKIAAEIHAKSIPKICPKTPE